MEANVDYSQPLYLAHAKGNASEAKAKHAGVGEGGGGEVCERSEQEKNRSPPPTQSSLPFALASSSLAILSAGSTIETKYEKIEGCEQSKANVTQANSSEFSSL